MTILADTLAKTGSGNDTGEISGGPDRIVESRRQETLLKTGALQDAIFKSAYFSCIATDANGLVPVVIPTSSKKEEQDLIQGYSLGANSYVRKPVDFAEFQEAVRLPGVYWLMTNQPPPKRNAA